MKRVFLTFLAICLTAAAVESQTVQPRQTTPFQVSDYGVDFQADQRLIVVMAALEAAGHDPVPPGRTPSVFRTKLRSDLANLDPDLRARLKNFYDRNKLP